jgi:hypothetical protein
MSKFPAVLCSVLILLGMGDAYADADMFRIIENFEGSEINSYERMHRSPFAYRPVDPALWGQLAGGCGGTCKGIAAQFKTPIKNGCPVVSEEDF